MSFFDCALWQQVVATVLGVFIGFWSALGVDRIVRGRRIREERRELITALVASLHRNVTLLKEISVSIDAVPLDRTYAYRLDLTILEATAYRKWEILASVRQCKAIDEARYALASLDDKLEMFRDALSQAFDYQLKLPIFVVKQVRDDHFTRVSDLLRETLGVLEGAKAVNKRPGT